MLEEIKNDLDKGALRLLSEYRGLLLRHAKTLVSSAEDAEDLVFCTIERVLAKVDAYDESKSDLLTWMKAIMVNIHRDGHRRKLSDAVTYCPTEEMDDLADDKTNETILRNSDSEYIRQVVATLPPELREVIVLQYFAEQPIAKVAKILAIPPGTVASRVHLAKKILVKKLATEFGKMKKPLAVLGAIFLGAMTLFGAYQTGLVEAVKSYFTAETPAPEPITETFVASSASEADVSNYPTSNSEQTSAVVSVEPITTFENNNENTETKKEEPMKLMKAAKTAALSAAVMLGADAASAGKTTASYVQNGLVAHWDAIDNLATGMHESEATQWVDLIGHVAFNGTFVIDEKSVAPAADIKSVIAGLWNLSTCTVEVLAYRTDGTGRSGSGFISTPRITMGYASNGADSFSTWLVSNEGLSWARYYLRGDQARQHGLATRTTSYAVGETKASDQPLFYYDGVLMDASAEEPWTGTASENNDVSIKTGTTYHSIRIYNRILSADEIANNQEVDYLRFRKTYDRSTDFLVAAVPKEYNTTPGSIEYGFVDVTEGEVLEVPAQIPFNNGKQVCRGYKFYRYEGDTYVLQDEGDGTNYTVTAEDLTGGRKLEWQWEPEYTYNATSYVREGLVANWDGVSNATNNEGELCHNPSATVWRDVVGGLEFQLNGAISFGANNYLEFKNDANDYGFLPKETPGFSKVFFAGSKTVEIVSEVGDNVCFLGGGDSNIGFAYSTGWAYILASMKARYVSRAYSSNLATYVAIFGEDNYFTSFVVDGVEQPLQSSSDTLGGAPTTGAWLGRLENAMGPAPFKGKVCAIRIYDRILNEKEIIYNKKVDDIRYRGASIDIMDELEMRINDDGELEYRLDVSVDESETHPGKVKVGSNAPVTSGSYWFTKNSSVTVTFVPETIGDYRYLEGPAVGSDRPTINSVTFAMPAHLQTVTAVDYRYDDGIIVTADPTVSRTTTFNDTRYVYVFTNSSLLTYHAYLIQDVTFEETLVVGGGGSGDGFHTSRGVSAGGGGGGVLWTGARHFLPVGSDMALAVGAGGRGGDNVSGNNGGNSAFSDGTIALTALGGGGAGKSGGSGGGWGAKGTDGQGYDGGSAPDVYPWPAGSGGGAEERGGNTAMVDDVITHGKGGDGRWDSITGVAHCYGSGGGSGSNRAQDVRGEGGAESGGAGCYNDNGTIVLGGNGVDGFGGGGGGGVPDNSSGGVGDGGCGTVILSLSLCDKMARQFSFDAFKTYPIKDGVAEPKPSISVGGVVLEEGKDYDITYERNGVAGRTAYMIVTGKGYYADIVVRYPFKPATIVFVKPDGLSGNGGTSWTDAQDLKTAVERLAEGPLDIWCAAGEYPVDETLSLASAVDFVGGFAADPVAVAKKADNGAKTVIVGNGTLATFFTATLVASSKYDTISIADIVFKGSSGVAISRAADMNLKVMNCDFISNASALDLAGGYTYPIAISNCCFEGNWNRVVVRSTAAQTTFENCLFLTNGVPTKQKPSSAAVNNDYMLMYVPNGNGVLTMRNCRFVGNCASCSYGPVKFFYIMGAVNFIVDHCQFLGNELRRGMDGVNGIICYNTWGDGVLSVIDSCTFAYNIINGENAAVVYAEGGDVSIQNSIFHHNVKPNDWRCQDVYVADAECGRIRYSMLDSTESDACYHVSDASIGVIAGDPRLKSGNLDDMILEDGSYIYYDPISYSRVLALDARLRIASPAINKGDPKSDWSLEPKPNGKRINMGAYGGTPWATCSPPGTAVRVR